MRNLINVWNRRWLWLLSGCLLAGMGVVACDCGTKPPISEGVIQTETGKETDILDGGPAETPAEGTLCSRNCDCPQGQVCTNGQCAITSKPVYCCDRDGCPQGFACEDSKGTSGTCGQRPLCQQTCDCDQGLGCINGFCSKSDTPVYCCEKAGCQPGSVCDSLRGGTGTCGGEGAACTSACDCIAGLSCINGQCTKSSVPIYCCDSNTCPTGQACETRTGSKGVCGQGTNCKTACDCQIGEACNAGYCRKTDVPVYCCDTPSACPAGQICETRGGQRQQCPSQPGCKVHCDCAQGQFCNNGTCVTGGTQVYCCGRPGCPDRAACYNQDGSIGTCSGQKCASDTDCGSSSCTQQADRCTQTIPRCQRDGSCGTEVATNVGVCDPNSGSCRFTPPQCKVACDCPQGLNCIQGQCQKSTQPVYCCDKEGCPSNTSCLRKDGSAGVCPTTPQCKSDADCSPSYCKQNGDACLSVISYCDTTTAACGLKTQTIANADCVSDPTGASICIPRKPAQCKSNTDCPVAYCSQSGNDCILTQHSCLNGQCIQDRGQVTSNAQCVKDPASGKGQCVPIPPQCRSDSDCGNPSCSQSGTSCTQVIPTCTSSGQCVRAGTGQSNAFCDANSGKCIPTPPPVCKTACDCSQGFDCINNQCISGFVPVYCCSKAGCPKGSTCINPDNTKGQCPNITCQSDADCGAASCTQSGTSCVRNVPRCISGTCLTSTVSTSGYCNSSNGTCTSVSFCSTHCDCPQGQACRQVSPGPGPAQGICLASNPPTYCCENAGCPSKQVCTTKSGGQSTCPATCKTPCDCSSGEDCINNLCTVGTKPVYCCDDTQKCPPGATCRDKNNQAGTCPQTPRPCKSVCDCTQGEACTNGQCAASSSPVYCCDNTGCPAGKACVDLNGRSGVCPQTCQETCDCPQGQFCQRGVCTAGTAQTYCCDKTGCPSGSFCYKKGGGTGTCPAQKCTSPCDCTQGQDCRNGLCTNVFPAVYCCGASGCPTGQACKDKSNVWSTCAGQPACKSPCDCPQGQDCYRGQCIQISPAVYCCDNVGCPPGQTCYDSSNQQSFCPGSQCTTACDCPAQGQACVRGRCVYSNPRIFCCTKPGCQAGNLCEDSNAKQSLCPGQACKTACDCNQGQDCRNGNCVQVSPPVYCCSKANCVAGQPCTQSNGSSSTCPVQCRTRCDCSQGQECVSGTCVTRQGAYCCNKTGCPTGQPCVNTSGQSSTCGGGSGITCKVRCDCAQGDECSNGQCVASPVPVYCCDKTGCPSRFVCQDKSGNNGFCP